MEMIFWIFLDRNCRFVLWFIFLNFVGCFFVKMVILIWCNILKIYIDVSGYVVKNVEYFNV